MLESSAPEGNFFMRVGSAATTCLATGERFLAEEARALSAGVRPRRMLADLRLGGAVFPSLGRPRAAANDRNRSWRHGAFFEKPAQIASRSFPHSRV